MKDFANKFFTAVNHLTISKRIRNRDISHKEIKQSLLFFPLAGFCIGLLLVLINFTTGHFLPSPVIDILVILFLLALTEAKHLKGFLSMVSGITGFSETKSMPSNIELKLFLLLFFVLMMKFLLLNNIVPGWKNAVLLVMPVLGRWALIFLPYLQMNRPGQNLDINPLYGKIDIKDFWIGTITTSIIALLLGMNGIVIFMLITFVVVFFERSYQRKKQGGRATTKRAAAQSPIKNFAKLCIRRCKNQNQTPPEKTQFHGFAVQGVPENLSLGIVEITEILTLLFFVVLESNSRNFIPEGILV